MDDDDDSVVDDDDADDDVDADDDDDDDCDVYFSASKDVCGWVMSAEKEEHHQKRLQRGFYFIYFTHLFGYCHDDDDQRGGCITSFISFNLLDIVLMMEQAGRRLLDLQ